MNPFKEGLPVEGREFPPITHPRFVLLLGPSGVGKSSILDQLVSRDPRMCLNPVYTNRPIRDEDSGRVSLTDDEINQMKEAGELLTDSPKYGNRYVIKRSDVQAALDLGRIPMQDYPIGKLDDIEASGIPSLTIYVAPPSLVAWRERLEATGRDVRGDRFREGLAELRMMAMNGYVHPQVDETVINEDLGRATDRIQYLIYRSVSRGI